MYYLLAFDSRGKELENLLKEGYDGRFHILIESGANIEQLVTKVKESIMYVPYTHVMLQVGVNELTTKIGHTVVFNYNTSEEAVENMKAKYISAKKDILETKGVNIIISPLIGISLSRYNKEHWYHQEQELINEAVLEINRWIKHENAKNSLETPMLDRKIHKQQGKGRKPIHKYSKLKFDGLHLSDTIKKDWADELVRVMRHHDQ